MAKSSDFSRQSFLGPRAQETLAITRVVIVGLGGGGSHIAQQLAHIGVGEVRIIDPDRIEDSNLNRLIGGTQRDVEDSTHKVDIAKRMITGIRPWISVPAQEKRWQEVDHLIKDAHVLIGCVDGYLQRSYLETAARRYGLAYIDIGMDVVNLGADGFAVAGQMIATLPGGPCMRCIGFLTDEKLNLEENRYGDAGINPQVVWTNGLLASLAVGALVKLVTPWVRAFEPFTWLEVDGNKQTVTPSKQPEYVPRTAPCPHHNGAEDLGDPFFDIRKLEKPV